MDNDVAIFLDLDNLVIGSKEVRHIFDINLVMVFLKDLTKGRIVLRRAYGDWRQSDMVPEELAAAGFELQSTVRLSNLSKNLADMQLVVDAMETLIDGHNFATYVLITGDRDFTPLVQGLRKRGKKVIGMGMRHSASRSLVSLCDQYIYYEDLAKIPSSPPPPPPPAKASKGKEAREVKVAPPPVKETPPPAPLPPPPAELYQQYRTELKKRGLRIVPAGHRFTILKDIVTLLQEPNKWRWGDLLQNLADKYQKQENNEISKNIVNGVMLLAKRARILAVVRGKTLSTAQVNLNLPDSKPFQEAVMRCDVAYLREIQSLEIEFEIEQAAKALYDSPNHARYLKVLLNRYGKELEEGANDQDGENG